MKLVVIGGGTGLYTLLSGLKKFNFDITAIVSTADSGGSSGILRDEYGMLPPGDIRKCIVALSESEQLLRKLFAHRFDKGGLKGHSFGNLLITALTEITGSFEQAIKEAEKILSVKGKVLPCTLDNVTLCALLENKKKVKGQVEVNKSRIYNNSRIKKLYMQPKAKAYKPAIKAIKEAEVIILGPGSLYTSVLPNLLVSGISKAINKSKAKKVYVVNIMTEHGETDGFTASQHVNEVEKYLQGQLDYVIVNTAKAPENLMKKYQEEYKSQVIPDIEKIKAKNKVIKGDFLRRKNLLRHDSYKLAKVIHNIKL
ncbi:hypothetical protein B6U80_00060 [Candidatus Pacearchaeota archaeon ex4484_26]|nr:MAG: hypothetical protein B6U80_00060 [Candidatus Pacearchaeota archaeon ex4484_26]